MTHHVMNQMGHKGPNMLGADAASLRRAIRPLIPEYMPMGTTGMDDMTEMQTDVGSDHSKQMTTKDMRGHSGQMAMPENTIAMRGGKGPHGIIDIGGMFTVLKVRERLTSYADPGWYEAPRRTMAQPASKQDLARDGIKT
jgi:manganese oxidase